MPVTQIQPYTPIYYAQEALKQLYMALGMANRVYRGYDEERRTFGKGDTIKIRRPGTFTVGDAPTASAPDLAPTEIEMKLDYWRDVVFKVRDDQKALALEQLVAEHIGPAAYVLAVDIDSKLNGLFNQVPWTYALNANPGSVVTDFTGPQQILFDNKVPMDQNSLYYEIDGTMQANALANPAFAQWQGAGQSGVNTQLSGNLGNRYGFNVFANQNIARYTTGTGAADVTGTLTGTPAAGATTITVGALTINVAAMMRAGDTFTIAGQLTEDLRLQQFVVTSATVATDGSGNTTFSFQPGLPVAGTNGAVVTLAVPGGTAAVRKQLPVFHREAFAMAMAKLPEVGASQGAMTASIQDPVTNLAIRASMWYEGKEATSYVRLDILYGVKCIDPNKAVRAWYV